MLIHLSSWPEIDERLKSGALLSKTVIVPIGSNEQHGPTGLLGTDWLCPEIIAHAAEKGAAYARRRMGGLRLVVNCDVPGLANIEGWPLEQCGIRITEGGRLMDPSSALRVHGELVDRGIPIALGASRTGSQTPLFIPQCRAISLALPAEEAHVTPTRAYLPALETLIRALEAIPGTSPAR